MKLNGKIGLVSALVVALALGIPALSSRVTVHDDAELDRGADRSPELLAAGAWSAVDPARMQFAIWLGDFIPMARAGEPDPRVELLRAVAEDPAATFVLFCGAERPDYFTAEFFARVSMQLPDDGASAVAVASTLLDLTRRAEAGERRFAPAAAALADLVLGIGTVADEVPDGRWAPFVADVVAAYPNALVHPFAGSGIVSDGGLFPLAMRLKASPGELRTRGFVSLVFADDDEARDDAQRVEEAMDRFARAATGTLGEREDELGDAYGLVAAAQAQRWIAEARPIDEEEASGLIASAYARAGVLVVAAWGTADDVESLEAATGRSLDEILAALAERDVQVAEEVVNWIASSSSDAAHLARLAGEQARLRGL